LVLPFCAVSDDTSYLALLLRSAGVGAAHEAVLVLGGRRRRRDEEEDEKQERKTGAWHG
jgi:hypothetical protein